MFCILLCNGQSGSITREDTGEAQERNEAYYTHNSWSQEARHVCYIGSSGKHKGDPEVLEGRTQGDFLGHGITGVSEGKTQQIGVKSLKLADLNNFSKLWAEVISSCLVPGPGLIKMKDYSL